MRHRLGRARRHRRAAARGERGANPRPAAPAMSACARGAAAGGRAGRVSTASFRCCAGRRAISPPSTLDMDGLPQFDRRVYEVARTHCARRDALLRRDRGSARRPGAWRGTSGQALGRNPFPIIVPCHRVLAAGGKAGGFSANGGDHHEAAPAHDRTRAHQRYAHAVRRRSARSVSRCEPRRRAAAERAIRGLVRGCQGCAGHPYMRSERTAS